MASPFLSLFALLFALGAACAPHATLSQAEDDQDEHELKSGQKVSYGTIGSQAEAFIKSSKSLVKTSRISKKEVANVYVSASHKAVPITVPLICVFFVLLALLILKMTYLKQRRLQTIHELPILLTTLHEEDEQESVYGHLSTRVAGTLNTADMHSMCSNASRPASKRSSTASSNNGTSRNVRQRIDSAPGLLVGLLGSPDWETNMQRELADHQWRLRRESRQASDNSQHRHTWHSQQSYAYSRHSTARSRPESSVSAERRGRRHSGRHSSLRIPHVSSFGEVALDTFRDRRRRPKSLNAVVDQMCASQSGSTPDRSPATSIIWHSGSYVNDTGGGSGFSASVNARSQRPSTISEVDTPRSTLSRDHDASFRFRVTDYGGGTPVVNASVASPVLRRSAQTGSADSGLGSASMEVSSILEPLNASVDSSIGSSWRQLPQFPSPPATPISPESPTPQTPNSIEVNTICVEPCYFNEQFYNGVKASSSELICASGYGLRFLGEEKSPERSYNQLFEFAPSTMDFGWPTLSDTLVSDLLHLVLPSPLDEGQCRAAISSQSPPMLLTPELTDASAQRRQAQEAPANRRNDGHSGFLSPFAANIQNRHHSRVREHVPFSLVAPPPAYLKSPRFFERTVQFSLGEHEMTKEDNARPRSTLPAASLVDFSAPVCPSPLRRVASMDSIASSRASTRGIENAVNVGNEPETSTECVVEHDEVESGVSVKPSEQEPEDKISQSMVETQAADAYGLKPKASHASLFLDLGGSSIGFGGEPSEFYSFDSAENAGMEQSLRYSQASSSGILAGAEEECSREDIEYIVELHSGSFTGVQHGMDNYF